MPLSATPKDIKAYQELLEKNKIKPDNLPPCPRCFVESAFFKAHAYRERKFLIIVEMWVKTVLSALLRFRCPGCGKTFTYYPDFAIPYKHYTRQTAAFFSRSYVQNPDATYQTTVMVDDSTPGYPDNEKTMAPSTVYRFITSLSRMAASARKALDLICQETSASDICRNIADLNVPLQKYKTTARKDILLKCMAFFDIEALFHHTFNTSIFTKLAIRYAFG